jgi:SAM-dependent methyltransferase
MDLAKHIQGNIYLRERLAPAYGELTYLHLSDLRLAIERIKTDQPITILDYGCGGSPYRSLFPQATYKRADFLQAEGDTLDYQLTEDSHVNEADAYFDLIISTQVLEHVREPANYLSECYRLLNKTGWQALLNDAPKLSRPCLPL